jgi:hypothetical protein
MIVPYHDFDALASVIRYFFIKPMLFFHPGEVKA